MAEHLVFDLLNDLVDLVVRRLAVMCGRTSQEKQERCRQSAETDSGDWPSRFTRMNGSLGGHKLMIKDAKSASQVTNVQQYVIAEQAGCDSFVKITSVGDRGWV